MKKYLITGVFCLSLLLMLAGCSGSNASNTAEQTTGSQAESIVTETDAAADSATENAGSDDADAESAQAEEEILTEEIIKLSTVSLNDNELLLPVDYEEFYEATGYGFDNSTNEDYTESTKLPAYTTLTLNYEIEDGYLFVLLANQTDKEIAAKDAEVIAIKLDRYGKEDDAGKFNFCGVDWDSSYQDIIDILGESEDVDELRDYHMVGYSVKRDKDSNVSYSFVADDDILYSFALSIDNMNITYDSLESQEETTE